MAHEIYYTSAPEGLRPNTRGFCTVGATDGIPKPLWERLEALSGYRHHAAAGSGRGNPVLHAHWLLNIAGKEYHVLSRVCDAGVDYTQRTNAFAHHVALEPAELAPAGPAWMLGQPGVMKEAWDGRVGGIGHHAPLPRGDEGPAVCSAWAHVTGDAGWAGVLAEAFAKSPWKPVCILFDTRQDVLPLMAEAIRLLPENQRWQATFSTYFTSMPTSATCVWRCCVAKTPAAEAAKRYAANGLVLNLAEPDKLGAPLESPWVTMARTGQSIHAAPPRPVVPARKTPPVAQTVPVQTVQSVPPEQPLIDLAPLGTPPVTSDPPQPRYESRVAIDRGPTRPTPGGMITVPPPRADTEALKAELAGERSRWKLMLIAGTGALAVSIGAVVLYFAYITANTAPPPPENPPKAPVVANTPKPEGAQTPMAISATQGSPETSTRMVTVPVTQTQVVHPPQTIHTPLPPKPIHAKHVMELAVSRSGVTRAQRIPLGEAELEHDTSSAMTLSFPGGTTTYVSKEAPDGILTVKEGYGRSTPGFSLEWQPDGSRQTTTVAYLTLDQAKAELIAEWPASVVLKQPAVASLAYWLVQAGTISVVGPDKSRGQTLVLKAPELKPLKYAEASAVVTYPAPLPANALPVVLPKLPAGWQADTFLDWDVKDDTLKVPANAVQVLRLQKTTNVDAIRATVLVKFREGFTQVECLYAKRRQGEESALNQALVDLRNIDHEFKRITDEVAPDLAAAQKDLAAKQAMQKLSDDALSNTGYTRASLQQQITAINGRIEQLQKKISDDSATLAKTKAEKEALIGAYQAALVAYGELKAFDVGLELPQGVRLVTLRFVRE